MGRLEVITGPMYSGKSEELLRRLRRASIAGKATLIIKPDIDQRYDVNKVVAHSGEGVNALSIDYLKPVLIYDEWIKNRPAVVGIDEVQFFDEAIVMVVKKMIEKSVQIIVSGLDMDFRQEPFDPMPILMAIADRVDKFNAVCNRCGEDAIFTQRLKNGLPASFSGPIIEVGGLDTYEARCRKCYNK